MSPKKCVRGNDNKSISIAVGVTYSKTKNSVTVGTQYRLDHPGVIIEPGHTTADYNHKAQYRLR